MADVSGVGLIVTMFIVMRAVFVFVVIARYDHVVGAVVHDCSFGGEYLFVLVITDMRVVRVLLIKFVLLLMSVFAL